MDVDSRRPRTPLERLPEWLPLLLWFAVGAAILAVVAYGVTGP